MSKHSDTVTSKRSNKKGMTSHFIRGDVIWLNYYVDGKRKRKSTKLKNTPQNIKLVTQQMVPALDSKIATGEIYKKKPKTFEYYGRIFLEHKDHNKTYGLKVEYWKRVIEHFRGQDIDSITRLDCKQYLNTLKMLSRSKSTYKSCMKEIFEFAVDDGVISFNPALGIKLKPEPRKEVEYFTREEVAKIMEVAKGPMIPYLKIAFNTGMRTGEILGLQMGDFKDDGFIHIKRTRTKGMLGTGKTQNSIRKVPYPPFLLDAVKKFQDPKQLFIFGEIDDAQGLRVFWLNILKNSRVPKRKMYCTRHTFATLMLKENIVSLNELAGLLGHSSPKVTLEHYASIINTKNIDLGTNFSLFADTSRSQSKIG
ncbi:MAG: hypothetical protein COA44_06005 [Arcobacter sp.]|nr:MAG: hypothetical protein COA44_06005 [Arcobacter sp.]